MLQHHSVVIFVVSADGATHDFPSFPTRRSSDLMKSDLRNLVTAEEAYFADSIKYTTTKSCVNPAPAGSVAFCTTTVGRPDVCTPVTPTQPRPTATVTNTNTATKSEIHLGATTPA